MMAVDVKTEEQNTKWKEVANMLSSYFLFVVRGDYLLFFFLLIFFIFFFFAGEGVTFALFIEGMTPQGTLMNG